MNRERRDGEEQQQHGVPEHLAAQSDHGQTDERRREFRQGVEQHESPRIALADAEPRGGEAAHGHRDGDADRFEPVRRPAHDEGGERRCRNGDQRRDQPRVDALVQDDRALLRALRAGDPYRADDAPPEQDPDHPEDADRLSRGEVRPAFGSDDARNHGKYDEGSERRENRCPRETREPEHERPHRKPV